MDILIIGAGLSGATIANKYAKAGKKVVLLEKRWQVGGNVFDVEVNKVLVHAYGPHVFHTDNEKVNKFMNNFWELNDYKSVVEAKVLDKVIPLPFNFSGIDKFWPNETEEIKRVLTEEYGKDSRVSINELLKSDNETIKKIADFVFTNIFENYTTKMWGTTPDKIDESVIERVPVVIGYNNTYSSNKFEGVPKEGYSNAIINMLNHKNIDVRFGVDAVKELDIRDSKIFFEDLEVTSPIIYTGPIDALFNYSEGDLSYRSFDINFETIRQTNYQSVAIMNLPAHPTATRIVEYKNMTFQDIEEVTVISKEAPGKYKRGDSKFGIPYYPMANDESRKQYGKYVKLANKYSNLHLVGRLATFKYLNMDKAISNALDKAEELLS